MTSFAASSKGREKTTLCFLGYLDRGSAFVTVSCPDFAIKMYLILLSYFQRGD